MVDMAFGSVICCSQAHIMQITKECLIFPSSQHFFKILFIYLFIYLWLCWVFVSVRRLSLVTASGGHSSSRCTSLSLSWPLLLWSTGSRCAGSVVVAHGPSCSAVRGIFPDQGSNPCPLHWQADSQPVRHQGSPSQHFFQAIRSIVPHLLLLLPLDISCMIHTGPSHTSELLGSCYYSLNPVSTLLR